MVSMQASWFDGLTARRRQGTAHWDGGGDLLLREDGGEDLRIALPDVRFVSRDADGSVYTLNDKRGFRLRLPGPVPAPLAARLPAESRYGHWIDRLGLGRATILFLSISAVVVAIFMTAPRWIGPMIPPSWERRIGDAMVGDLGNRLCHTPEGDAALARLVDELDPERPVVRAGVANMGMVNAVALPGGQVLIFDGLIQDAKSPEELAGVLAHEIGHVRERHVMQAMVRQLGLSVLLSGLDSSIGSGVLGVAAMSYSRDAEREADEYARERMADADVSPIGAAQFFERASKEQGKGSGWTSWISTHPAPAEREEAFRDATDPNRDYPAPLTKAEFAALKSMCAKDKDVEEWTLF